MFTLRYSFEIDELRGVSGKFGDWACCMRFDSAIKNPITSSYYAICLQYIAVIAVPIAHYSLCDASSKTASPAALSQP